jgi:hypothetical protein
MRTLEITAYTFDELSYTAKETAINNNRDINTNHDWWSWTYEDSENFGIKITSFDIYRIDITIEFTIDPLDVANNILNECGPTSDLHSIAETFITDRTKLVAKYSDGHNLEYVLEDNWEQFDEDVEQIETTLRYKIRMEYIDTLVREYEYLESDEAVTEALMANMSEFTEDGKNLKY